MPKMTLGEAAQLVGLSVNGMRSRAKADPVGYRLTRDNTGRLWLDFEPSTVGPVKPAPKGATAKPAKPSLEGHVAVLEARLQAADAARRSAETERDHWRDLALDLARRRRWWLW